MENLAVFIKLQILSRIENFSIYHASNSVLFRILHYKLCCQFCVLWNMAVLTTPVIVCCIKPDSTVAVSVSYKMFSNHNSTNFVLCRIQQY